MIIFLREGLSWSVGVVCVGVVGTMCSFVATLRCCVCAMEYRALSTFGVQWVKLDLLFGWWNWLGKHSSNIWKMTPAPSREVAVICLICILTAVFFGVLLQSSFPLTKENETHACMRLPTHTYTYIDGESWRQLYFNLVLFNFGSQLYIYWSIGFYFRSY
jgi:hypothetical protein